MVEDDGNRVGSEVRRVEDADDDEDSEWTWAGLREFLLPDVGYGYGRDDGPGMWDLYTNKLIVSITGFPANG